MVAALKVVSVSDWDLNSLLGKDQWRCHSSEIDKTGIKQEDTAQRALAFIAKDLDELENSRSYLKEERRKNAIDWICWIGLNSDGMARNALDMLTGILAKRADRGVDYSGVIPKTFHEIVVKYPEEAQYALDLAKNFPDREHSLMLISCVARSSGHAGALALDVLENQKGTDVSQYISYIGQNHPSLLERSLNILLERPGSDKYFLQVLDYSQGYVDRISHVVRLSEDSKGKNTFIDLADCFNKEVGPWFETPDEVLSIASNENSKGLKEVLQRAVTQFPALPVAEWVRKLEHAQKFVDDFKPQDI